VRTFVPSAHIPKPTQDSNPFRSLRVLFSHRASIAGGLIASLFFALPTHAQPAAEQPPAAPSLDDCIAVALRNNHRRQVSRFAVAAAEAQHRQALAAYWPQVQASAMYRRLDEPPDFIFPAASFAIPAQTVTVPASTALVTVPAGVLGPTAVQLPVNVPAQSISTPAQTFTTPPQTVKTMNVDSVVGSASMTWLLLDGGMRDGMRRQGESLVAAMKQEARRTDLEIVDAVKRMYYGAVLARQLHRLGDDTLARMDATLQLTETMYQHGSGKVTKADYLDNKIMVESIRAIVATLEKNETMAQAALANTMGLTWRDNVVPGAQELPAPPPAVELERLVADTYAFSPDWKRLEEGLQAAEASVSVARSGHAPKIALVGDLHAWENSYDAGVATKANKRGWTAGLAIELPLFDGFLTRNRVAETRARLERLKQEQLLLKEGLGLQVRDIVLSLTAAARAYEASTNAQTAAEENRGLNVKAYQNELVETEKVIRAQLMEALMDAQTLKVRYDRLALQSQLELVVGSGIAEAIATR
jgi:outer membrane protein TolC